MPYRVEEFEVGGIYHIFNRGALKNPLFFSPEMYWTFCYLIERFAADYHIRVLQVCLMPNHFHLLIMLEEGGSVEDFMQRLCHTYARRINRLLRRIGTIFQGRYGSTHINSTEYVFEICRYIHLNPITENMVAHPADWEYSSYHEAIGERNVIKIDNDFVPSLFGGQRPYEAYILNSLHNRKYWSSELLQGLAKMKLV
ncbi:MAG: transposase [Ignavibacteriae bacterium]|nr:MAG: transposase [Ignavibacteriota bacterium]